MISPYADGTLLFLNLVTPTLQNPPGRGIQCISNLNALHTRLAIAAIQLSHPHVLSFLLMLQHSLEEVMVSYW